MSELSTASRVKPRFRGVSHQLAAPIAAGAGLVLVAMSPTLRAAGASALYAATLVLMFTISATYHRIDWAPPARALMRRLDHAAIFLVIAGTYSPICLLGLGGEAHGRLLALVWTGALAGVLQATFWVRAPRFVTVALYLALGWVAVAYFGELRHSGGVVPLALLVAGGVLYSAGAMVYALRRPDPRPAIFGYHEIFHALVVAASACHFVAVLLLVRAAG